MNLFPTDLNFENPDEDYQFSDQKDESDTFLLGGFIIKSALGVSFFEQADHFSSPIPSLDRKACILRC